MVLLVRYACTYKIPVKRSVIFRRSLVSGLGLWVIVTTPGDGTVGGWGTLVIFPASSAPSVRSFPRYAWMVDSFIGQQCLLRNCNHYKGKIPLWRRMRNWIKETTLFDYLKLRWIKDQINALWIFLSAFNLGHYFHFKLHCNGSRNNAINMQKKTADNCLIPFFN